MLVALRGNERVEAFRAVRAEGYCCPQCQSDVRLRRRKGYVLHFYHLVNADCPSQGEGAAHLAAKQLIGDEYRKRGLNVEFEWTIAAEMAKSSPRAVFNRLPVRRTDIMVYRRGNKPCAIEIQDSGIAEAEFFGRIRDWHGLGIPLLWVAVPPPKLMAFLETAHGGELFERYAIRPFERWMAKRDGKLWYFHPLRESFFVVQISHHMLWKEGYLAYDQSCGDFVGADGYEFRSTRFVDLRFSQAIPLDKIRISISNKNIPRWHE